MGMSIKRILHNISSILKYPTIHQALAKERKLYFFSYSWSFGGGERVFIDMLNAFKDQKSICFVTGTSVTKGFKNQYQAAVQTINLARWAHKKILKQYLLKKMAQAINAQKKPVVIGWSSEFMYELIPFLAAHVKIIDITHNFTDDGKGLELKTLRYVPRINKRIVVSRGLTQQFEELYQLNDIPQEYLNRIVFIRNKIPFNNFFPQKDYHKNLQIIFVARNSPEKRSDVVIKIAEKCLSENLPVSFKMLGDYDPKKIKAPSNVEIIGVISNKNIVNEYYKHSHILLLTSQRESWGLVIFEAMNFGAVPISTNVGDLLDYISEEKANGILVENTDNTDLLSELFINEIKKFCHDRTLLEKFSKNAFETVKKLVSTPNFEQAYRDVILDDAE